eukprot:gnl/Trimastix_PCT/175.p1 GENE.gnl/Trimastix_PCT/175~~gnl/Trimastix_PCT/175.p1  ORF type:complete len:244 (-),score=89.01 gnl/Trimastix_PCT/175:56-787(-)
MKLLVLVFALLAVASAEFTLTQITQVSDYLDDIDTENWDLCPTCISFFDTVTQALIKIIGQVGVPTVCSELCNLLPFGKLIKVVCNLICDIAGLEEFVKIIREIDPDSVYYCQRLHICPVDDSWNGTVKSVVVDPPTGPAGTTFAINVTYTLSKKTSVGIILNRVVCPAQSGYEGSEFLIRKPAGTYIASWTLETEPTEKAPFVSGEYFVKGELCNGECRNRHPHSKVLSEKWGSFNITEIPR